MRKLNKIKRFKDWEKKIESARFCPTCRNWYFDPMNREHIKNTNLCMRCEHAEEL